MNASDTNGQRIQELTWVKGNTGIVYYVGRISSTISVLITHTIDKHEPIYTEVATEKLSTYTVCNPPSWTKSEVSEEDDIIITDAALPVVTNADKITAIQLEQSRLYNRIKCLQERHLSYYNVNLEQEVSDLQNAIYRLGVVKAALA